jgi:16S rRNA (adenine1518-N6/adenine1519-N6)-dimethyltransferase
MKKSKIVPKKSLGQHWLYDQPSLEAMAEAADLTSTDDVLEVGPGLGTLTLVLLNTANSVTAVELDKKLSQRLNKTLNSPKLEVLNEDILSFDLNKLPEKYKVIANIPYYLTSKLIRNLSEADNPPQTAVLLMQKEVAERVAAQPGKMSILSVTAQYFWEVSLNIIVGSHLFTPPPKVDSQIVVMKRRSKPLYGDVTPEEYFRTVKAGFSNKRKTLMNSLSSDLKLGHSVVGAYLNEAGIDPNRRAQTLTLEEWHQLTLAIT